MVLLHASGTVDRRCSPARAEKPLPPSVRADRILILKSQRELQLLSGGKVLKSYRIALGTNPVGPKQRQGDGKTPEGIYKVSGRNPKSTYHLSLRISYPNQQDIARARTMGISPGGDIFIHGLPKAYAWVGAGHRLKDWTLGCVAVTNEEIEEIWRLVPNGTVVECDHKCRLSLVIDSSDNPAEEPDYYYENGFVVFTASYLKRRGHCCRSGCRHCPYGYRADADSSEE